jgi:hypothetical protein
MNLDKPLYPIEEVAELTGFKLAQLIRDCRARRLDRVYRDRKHFMTPPQIEALIKQYTIKAAAPSRPAVDADERDRHRANRRLGRVA